MLGFLTGVTTTLHFLALIFIGVGGFLAWRWPRAIFLHAPLVVWGVAVNLLPLSCPFTSLEDYLRGLQGLGPLPGGFNEYYIYGTLIPHFALPVVAMIAVFLVVFSYVGAYQRWRDRQATIAW